MIAYSALMFVIAIIFIVFTIAAVVILIAGLVLGFSCILAVQKKYNSGLF